MPFIRLRKILPRGLFARSLLILVTPVVLLQLFMSYSFLDQHWREVTKQLSQSVAREIAFVIELENRAPGQDPNDTLQLASDAMGMTFELLPHAKMGKADERRQTILSRMIGAAVKRRMSYPTRVQLGREADTYEIEVATSRGLLRVTVPEKRVFTITTFQFIFWFTGAAAILLLISILFLRGQVRPIRRLAEAAEAFGNGVEKEFKLEGAREVRRAGTAFLLMRERIRRQISQRTEMLAGVSHDLRTPLTRMKLQLAMWETDDASHMKNDIAEMEAMIEAYLQFARGDGEETAVPVAFHALLEQLVADAERAGAGKIALSVVPVQLTLRPQAVRRAISNLIQNALTYGTQCHVAVAATDDQVVVTIDDDGPGIPAESREDVFRPFYRLEQSRNRASGGIGLGLAIARDVIRAHGGEITLAESEWGGLRVMVSLPV